MKFKVFESYFKLGYNTVMDPIYSNISSIHDLWIKENDKDTRIFLKGEMEYQAQLLKNKKNIPPANITKQINNVILTEKELTFDEKMKENDMLVEEIGVHVSRLNDMAHVIYEKIHTSDNLLDGLSNDIDNTSYKVQIATKKTEELIKQARCCNCLRSFCSLFF